MKFLNTTATKIDFFFDPPLTEPASTFGLELFIFDETGNSAVYTAAVQLRKAPPIKVNSSDEAVKKMTGPIETAFEFISKIGLLRVVFSDYLLLPKDVEKWRSSDKGHDQYV